MVTFSMISVLKNQLRHLGREVFAFLLLFITLVSLGNDGVYYASGGQLFPMQETEIELHKEILHIDIQNQVDSGWATVNVHFEFYNPKEGKEVLVGFECPGPMGDVLTEDSNMKYIQDFVVILNKTIIPHRVHAKENQEGYDFIYAFKTFFRKGKTTIQHQYRVKLGSSVMEEWDFHYILQTGKRWANNQIDTFQLLIQTAEKGPFFINGLKGLTGANVRIAGLGKYSLNSTQNAYCSDCVAFYLDRGLLSIELFNFQPHADLILFKTWSFVSTPDLLKYLFYPSLFDKPAEISKEQLAFARNYLYAQKGYNFKSKKWKAKFEKYVWYIPDATLNQENIVFTPEEKEFLKRILTLEEQTK